MNFDQSELADLEVSIADQIYLQIAKWRLYLGDAGLAKSLAIECFAYLDGPPDQAVSKALKSVKVPIADGTKTLPLEELIPDGQVVELIEIISPYCR